LRVEVSEEEARINIKQEKKVSDLNNQFHGNEEKSEDG